MADGVIAFNGHAGYVLEHGDVRLACDPWIEGDAFAHGWAPLSPAVAPTWSDVTHLWFSHEHPDHFSPRSIATIPDEDRRRIKVLFQRTRDRKVVQFLRGQGFASVAELGDEAFDLGTGITMRLARTGYADSASLVTSPAVSVLNLNDCLLTPYFRDRVHRLLLAGQPPVDVMLMQYSYAEFVGNRDQPQLRRDAAAHKLDTLLEMIKHVRPAYVIPFASFVWFCHAENAHFNETANRIDDVAAAITRQGIATPVVLYPGDEWTIGGPHNTATAISRYLRDMAQRSTEAPIPTTDPVGLGALQTAAIAYWDNLRSCHGRLMLAALARTGQLDPFVVRLTDHNTVVAFRSGSLTPTSLSPDLAMTSDALLRFFEALWGPDTISVSGRFEAVTPRAKHVLDQQARLGALANQQRRVHSAIGDAIGRRVRDRWFTATHRAG